jgi:hypothetical protein
VIYIGIDDTDVVGSPGTNQLARAIVARLGAAAAGAVVCRHQLFVHPAIPYTSQNGSASIRLPGGERMERAALIALVQEVMRTRYVEGSDPGLAVADRMSAEMSGFAARAQTEVVSASEAHGVAGRGGCHLEGLGGTHQGVIGALAAVALAAGGNDGRVVHVDGWPWPDPLSGVQSVAALRERGVETICSVSGEIFTGGTVDVGKHLRPDWRGGRIVLVVERSEEDGAVWRARRRR